MFRQIAASRCPYRQSRQPKLYSNRAPIPALNSLVADNHFVERVSPALSLCDRGLVCPAGDFAIDPVRPVDLAVITHAHSDHARTGSARYLCAEECAPILAQRLGSSAKITGVPWRTPTRVGGVWISFHPACHVRGSAQIRIETPDEIAVVTGDYKRAPDPTTQLFEVVPCDTLVTESTFALPIYRWDPTAIIIAQIADWWHANAHLGIASILYCYSLGKTQRVLAELALLAQTPTYGWIGNRSQIREEHRPIYLHGAAVALTEIYRQAGVILPPTYPITNSKADASAAQDELLSGPAFQRPFAGALVIAPPAAAGDGDAAWMKRFGTDAATAFASGWMRVRGVRRRRGHDVGFALSDHADWPGLIATVRETSAKRVLITHGSSDILARYLRELSIDAAILGQGSISDSDEEEA